MNIPTAFSQDNSTNKLYTLTGLLEAATQKTHTQCALRGEDFSYTYSEFNELTSFFACRLQEAGVKEGDLVGMVLERGAEMVIGIFGILKAGAAYVPADPSFPETRIVSLYQDAGVRFVVTTSDLSSFLSGLGFQPIVPDLVPSHIPADTTLLPQISPSHLAYVLFTSGSTGTPKGVMVEHHSVVNLLQYIQNRYPLQSADGVLFKSPYTFDGSIWEIFGWLLMGGTLCVAKPGAEKDPVALVKTIRNFRIRFMFFVPTMLGAFLDYLQTAGIRDAVQCLKWVSVGGEVLPVPMVKNSMRYLTEIIPDSSMYMVQPKRRFMLPPTSAFPEKPTRNCPLVKP